MLKFISIDDDSSIPKYLQIINSIVQNISVGNITTGDKIPSINSLSVEYYLSRDTVARAYNILKERNIIVSIQGKGNYIAKTKLISKTNILFLVNKLSEYKLKIYNSFREKLGENTHTDLHVYHCDESIFIELLKKYKSAYDYYVIMPHFKTENLKHTSSTQAVSELMNMIPKDKLILMDNDKHEVKGEFSEVFQDFENDIYEALSSGMDKVKKYDRLALVYPEKSLYPYPNGIKQGFRKFCIHNNLNFDIINKINDANRVEKNTLYITIEESDLVNLIQKIRNRQLEMGKDIGVISYNDTSLKDLLGISVVSTDFIKMGENAAEIINEHKKTKIKAPFNFIDRRSA